MKNKENIRRILIFCRHCKLFVLVCMFNAVVSNHNNRRWIQSWEHHLHIKSIVDSWKYCIQNASCNFIRMHFCIVSRLRDNLKCIILATHSTMHVNGHNHVFPLLFFSHGFMNLNHIFGLFCGYLMENHVQVYVWCHEIERKDSLRDRKFECHQSHLV